MPYPGRPGGLLSRGGGGGGGAYVLLKFSHLG